MAWQQQPVVHHGVAPGGATSVPPAGITTLWTQQERSLADFNAK